MPEVFGASSLGVMDITNPRLYETLDTMIREMSAVFKSSPYFHIGCDEARVHTDDQKFMKDHHSKGDGELFSYHVARMNEDREEVRQKGDGLEIPLNDLTPTDVIITVWGINFNHGETDTNINIGRTWCR